MSSVRFSQEPQVQAVLQRCRRQIRNHALLTGAASVCLVVVAGLLLAGVLDYILPLPGGVRATLLAGLILSVVFVVYKRLLEPLHSRVTDQQLGAAVDLSAPELQESLATLISIESATATSAEAGSDVMRRQLQKHVAKQIAQSVPAEVVDPTSTKRRCGAAGLVFCLAMIPVVVWPSISALLLNRLVSPFQNLSTVSNLYFDVVDPNRTVAALSDVEIVALPKWRDHQDNDLPDAVQLLLTTDDGATDSLPMVFDETKSAYVAVLNSISASVDFRVSASEVTTELFHLDVVDRPAIQTAVMVDTPAVYTGRAVQKFDGMLGDMEVFEGSQLEMELTFNKPVSEAKLVWLARDAVPIGARPIAAAPINEATLLHEQNPDVEVAAADQGNPNRPQSQMGTLSPDQMSARFELTAQVGGEFEFEFEITDQYLLKNIVTTSRQLSVLVDQAPQLSVGGLKDGDQFRADDIVPLNCLASDDIGLGELQLYYQINDDVERILPARDFQAGALVAETAFRVPLVDHDVEDGSVIRFRVKAADERPVPGPQITWSDSLTVTIDANAAPAGADALQAETENMIASLKLLEKLLHEDEQAGRELSQQIQKEFSDARRAETERLSEKQQQQGRVLQQLAEQVASHPLMEDSATALQKLGEQLRQDIPNTLDDAVNRERADAAKKVQQAATQIQQAADQLGKEIQKLEKTAQLEQELAELNRLALQAERLSEDAKQLDQDRQQADAKPDELSQEQWNQQLQDRQQALQQTQQDLSQDIQQLLQQQNELRKAAQNAQKQQLKQLADEVQKLAEQQATVAQGAAQEAKEVGRDANAIASELKQARRQAKQLNEKLDDSAGQANTDRLQQAIEELKQGNLADSAGKVSETAKEAEQIKNNLADAEPSDEQKPSGEKQSQSGVGGQEPTKPNVTDDGQAESNSEPQADSQSRKQNQADQQQAADTAGQVEERLREIAEQIQQLQAEKNLNSSAADQFAQAESQPAKSSQNVEPTQQDQQVEELLSELQNAVKSAQDLSAGAAGDPAATNKAKRSAKASAEKAEEGLQQAAAGRFQEASERLASASAAADSASQQLADQSAEDRQRQAELLSEGLGRLAENMQGLQQDDASQIAAQQKTQAQVAEAARDLPERLQDLQQTLQIPALQMQEEARQAEDAADAAQQAAGTSQQASENLEQGNLERASEEGRETAEQLQQVAEAARQAGQQGQQSSSLPNAVGQSVAEALRQLQRAAEAMQQGQPSGQPSEQLSEQGQPPRGQQSGPQSGQQPGQQQATSNSSNEQASQGSRPSSAEQSSAEQSSSSKQPSDTGQPSGNEQPASGGQSGSGSKSLSAAAESLADAAKQSLPAQHRPADSANTSSQASGDTGSGSASLWNGLIPKSSLPSAGGRNWGQLNDELDTDTSKSKTTSPDPEYEALIRMYSREAAKAK